MGLFFLTHEAQQKEEEDEEVRNRGDFFSFSPCLNTNLISLSNPNLVVLESFVLGSRLWFEIFADVKKTQQVSNISPLRKGGFRFQSVRFSLWNVHHPLHIKELWSWYSSIVFQPFDSNLKGGNRGGGTGSSCSGAEGTSEKCSGSRGR